MSPPLACVAGGRCIVSLQRGHEDGPLPGLRHAVVGGVEHAGPGAVPALPQVGGEVLPQGQDRRHLLKRDPARRQITDESDRLEDELRGAVLAWERVGGRRAVPDRSDGLDQLRQQVPALALAGRTERRARRAGDDALRLADHRLCGQRGDVGPDTRVSSGLRCPAGGVVPLDADRAARSALAPSSQPPGPANRSRIMRTTPAATSRGCARLRTARTARGAGRRVGTSAGRRRADAVAERPAVRQGSSLLRR